MSDVEDDTILKSNESMQFLDMLSPIKFSSFEKKPMIIKNMKYIYGRIYTGEIFSPTQPKFFEY